MKHMELCSVLCASLDGRGFGGEGICMAESLRCSSETITALVIGCTLIQSVFVLKNKIKFNK